MSAVIVGVTFGFLILLGARRLFAAEQREREDAAFRRGFIEGRASNMPSRTAAEQARCDAGDACVDCPINGTPRCEAEQQLYPERCVDDGTPPQTPPQAAKGRCEP